MTREVRMEREATAVLTRRMQRSLEWRNRGKFAKLSLKRLKTIHSGLVVVHGAAYMTEISTHVAFKDYMNWMCEERPATIEEIDRQQLHGAELLKRLSGLTFHQPIANVPQMAPGDQNRW